jgi:hypothetical protein
MSALTKAIVNHDLAGIARVMREQPELAWERNQDWLPIEWAAGTGNAVTYARANRLLASAAVGVKHRQLLRDYLVALSRTNYFGAVEPHKAARRAWEQMQDGMVHAFSKDEPDFQLDDEQKQDLELLMQQAGVQTKAELISVAETGGTGT